MISLALLIIGLLGGYFYRDLADRVKILEQHKPEPEIGVTLGAYTKPVTSNTGEIGISEPKTPQQVEFEAREKLEKDQLHVKVNPRT